MKNKIKVYRNGKLLRYFKDYIINKNSQVKLTFRPRKKTIIKIERNIG